MATPLSADRMVSTLKAAGLKVVEYPGWRTHNRNRVGAWGPVNGILIHHTAGSNSKNLVFNGRSDLPGPLAHAHLAKDGTVTLTGNGRANHAGKAARNAFDAILSESSDHPKPSAASGTVDGNARLYGIEIENLGNGRDPYPDVQYKAAVRWAGAIAKAHGWSEDSIAGHKETSIEGKIDPSFDMNKFRRDVGAWMRGEEEENDMADQVDLTANSVNWIAKAVWERRERPIAPSTGRPSTETTSADAWLTYTDRRITALENQLNDILEAVDLLSASIEALDIDDLKQRIANINIELRVTE